MTIFQTVSVPCGGCTACCKRELIVLHPEIGDDVSSYETDIATNPLTRKQVYVLKHKPNGDCIYLGDEGCTIHERAPAICREFDCRRFAKMAGNRSQRRKASATNEVVRAGVERMKTL